MRGYEIHMGRDARRGAGIARASSIDGAPRRRLSADGQILGTYLHGLFDDAHGSWRAAALGRTRSRQTVDSSALREASLERIADAVDTHLDTRALLALVEQPATCTA